MTVSAGDIDTLYSIEQLSLTNFDDCYYGGPGIDVVEACADLDDSIMTKYMDGRVSEITEAEIKRLNPKPGLKYGSVQMQPVVPDVLVRPAPDGFLLADYAMMQAVFHAQ